MMIAYSCAAAAAAAYKLIIEIFEKLLFSGLFVEMSSRYFFPRQIRCDVEVSSCNFCIGNSIGENSFGDLMYTAHISVYNVKCMFGLLYEKRV